MPNYASIAALASDLSDEAAFIGAFEPVQLIAESAITEATTIVEFTSIPQTWRHLELVVSGPATAEGALLVRLNADSGANYDIQDLVAQGTSVTTTQAFGASFVRLGATGAVEHAARALIPNYASTTATKSVLVESHSKQGTASTNLRRQQIANFWRSTAAITAVRVYTSGASLSAGGVVSLYGKN